MTWVILIVFLVTIGVMSWAGRQRVAWANRLWRVHPGAAHRAEWMAPDDVVQAVRDDYLAVMYWLPESAMDEWSRQWANAPEYLSGVFLARYQEILKHYRMGKPPRYSGVLRCLHQVDVRHFSDDGERCLVVDWQTSRRIATYDYWSQVRLHTQDLGDATVVYEMAYDKQTCRWKIDRLVQELPINWQTGKTPNRLRLCSTLSPAAGRDY